MEERACLEQAVFAYEMGSVARVRGAVIQLVRSWLGCCVSFAFSASCSCIDSFDSNSNANVFGCLNGRRHVSIDEHTCARALTHTHIHTRMARSKRIQTLGSTSASFSTLAKQMDGSVPRALCHRHHPHTTAKIREIVSIVVVAVVAKKHRCHFPRMYEFQHDSVVVDSVCLRRCRCRTRFPFGCIEIIYFVGIVWV